MWSIIKVVMRHVLYNVSGTTKLTRNKIYWWCCILIIVLRVSICFCIILCIYMYMKQKCFAGGTWYIWMNASEFRSSSIYNVFQTSQKWNPCFHVVHHIKTLNVVYNYCQMSMFLIRLVVICLLLCNLILLFVQVVICKASYV